MLNRYEFLPFECGESLRSQEKADKVIQYFTRNGWVEFNSSLRLNDIDNIVPSRVKILEKDNLVIYLPESGFGVVRVKFEYGDSADSVALSLRDRVQFQQDIGSHVLPEQVQDCVRIIREVRGFLRAVSKRSREDRGDEPVFTYSLSLFEISPHGEDQVISALLEPRSIGCGITERAEELPSVEEVHAAMSTVELNLPAPTVCSTFPGMVYSSWSSVVVVVPTGSTLIDLVSLCEFRVQSTWLAAYALNRISTNTPLVSSHSDQGMNLLLAGQEFSQITTRAVTRLGANSPHDATEIVENLVVTSELDQEIERANSAYARACERIEFATAKREDQGKKILEIFALIFAASGLAQLFFELPITQATFTDDVIPFLVWLIIVIVGVYVTLWQRR